MSDAHFDLAAAGMRADGSDIESGIEVLARKLEITLPGACKVHRRRRGLLSSQTRVTGIEVDLGATHLWLRLEHGAPVAGRSTRIHDMRRKDERLGLTEWLRAIEDELRTEAASSREAREALDRLLGD